MPRSARDVLIIEDSHFFRHAISQRLESELGLKTHSAKTYAEAKALLSRDEHDYFVAVLGVDLPDAPSGEIVDFVLSRKIPVVVFTSGVSDEVREELWAKHIVDYVLKGANNSLDYLTALVRRLDKNRAIEVLVVDDSSSMRKIATSLFRSHLYVVHEAKDGEKALDALKEHPGIRLVLTDYEMPNMDGLQLTERIRRSYSKEELAIIGISSSRATRLSVRFLKRGANDFIRKPFEAEEFYCRATQNIEMLEHITTIREVSERDFLTGLYNRRHFLEVGRTLHANAQRGNLSIAVAMIDIDHFKKVNDTHGHEAGDMVLQRVAQVLDRRTRKSDSLCRFGGEEFCILLSNALPAEVFAHMDEMRAMVESETIVLGDARIHVTVSIGLCVDLFDSVEGMIRTADDMLYEAKEMGRNRVEVFKP